MAKFIIDETVRVNPGGLGTVESCLVGYAWWEKGLYQGVITVKVERAGGPVIPEDIETAAKKLTCIPQHAEARLSGSAP